MLGTKTSYETVLLGLTPGGISFLPEPRLDPTPGLEFGVYKTTFEYGIRERYLIQRITKILKVFCEYKWEDECDNEKTSLDTFEKSDVSGIKTLISKSLYDRVISRLLIGKFGT
jgi:hypothetical protein